MTPYHIAEHDQRPTQYGHVLAQQTLTGCTSFRLAQWSCAHHTQFAFPRACHSIPISIYPNPAKDELVISSTYGIKLIEVNIYNQLGQRILQQHGDVQIIDISILPQGLYNVELVTEKSKIRRKFVVK